MKTRHGGKVLLNNRDFPFVLWDDQQRYHIALSQYVGKRITCELSRQKRRRSNSQNSYYWSVVIPLIQESGGYVLPEDAHEACKWALLKQRDKKVEYCRSTSSLSTFEMEDYLSKLRELASEGFFGDSVFIPLPNETEYNYIISKGEK